MPSGDSRAESSQASEPAVEHRRQHRLPPQDEGSSFGLRVVPGGLIRRIVGVRRLGALVSQVKQDAGDVDVHGADFTAGAAEAAGAGKLGGGVHSGHLRREDRTDRSGVDAAVGVATDLSVDGADIEAGAASDAPQGLGGHLFGQEFGTTIVDQDDVYFVGTIIVG